MCVCVYVCVKSTPRAAVTVYVCMRTCVFVYMYVYMPMCVCVCFSLTLFYTHAQTSTASLSLLFNEIFFPNLLTEISFYVNASQLDNILVGALYLRSGPANVNAYT